MKAVRINLYQQTAQFRIPMFTGKVHTTFLLPPYSTIIGMVHCLCEWNTTHAIKVSVTCTNERLSSPQSNLALGWIGGTHTRTISEEFQLRFPIIVEDGYGGYIGWTRKIIEENHLIMDRHYTIHVSSENEEQLQEIYKAFSYPPVYPSLGRWEDTVRIDDVKVVEVTDEEQEGKLNHFVWLPCEKSTKEIIGTVFKIPTFYKIEKGKTGRIFDYSRCYIGSRNTSAMIRLDEDNKQVIFF